MLNASLLALPRPRSRKVVMPLLLALAVTLAFTSCLRAQCQYEVTAIIEGPPCDLGPPTASIFPSAINENSEVVGSYNVCIGVNRRAFYWSKKTGLVTLPMPPGVYSMSASDINDAGTICGTWWTNNASGGRRGWVYWPDTQTYIELDTVTGNGWSLAHAINNDNVVVGERAYTDDVAPRQAFIWSSDDGFLDLPPTNAGGNNVAHGIDDTSNITGIDWSALPAEQAFTYKDGHYELSGAIPNGTMSRGRDIGSDGLVVGAGRTLPGDGGYLRAFVLDHGAFTIIDPLPGHEHSTFEGVNNTGTAVGQSIDAKVFSDRIGIAWRGTGRFDMNDLLPPGHEELTVQIGQDVNDHGSILAGGRLPDRSVATILSPLDVPPGDINTDCRVDVFDLLELLALWKTSLPVADLNVSGEVNVFDLLDLLGNWTT